MEANNNTKGILFIMIGMAFFSFLVSLLKYIFEDISEEANKVRESVKQITRNRELLDSNEILKTTLKIRNTYLDPLSLIQILLMKKLVKKEITEEEKTSLLLSINGLAAGLRNTG